LIFVVYQQYYIASILFGGVNMLKLSAVNWACRIIILFCCAAGLLLSSCATEPSRVSETIPEPSPVVKETPVEDQPAPAVSAPVKPVLQTSLF
jgi:hypothetical protein